MRFGFVTDELSQDPREAIETALEWGVRDFEIRNVGGARFPASKTTRLATWWRSARRPER